MPLTLFFNFENEKKFIELKKFVSYLKCKYELTEEEVIEWFKTRRNSAKLISISKEESEQHTEFKNEIENYCKLNNIIRNTTLNWLKQKEYKQVIPYVNLELKDKIVYLFSEKNKTVKELAGKFNLTEAQITQIIYIVGRSSKKDFYEKREQDIIKLYNKGYTYTEISNKLKMPYATIYGVINSKYKFSENKKEKLKDLESVVNLVNKKNITIKEACIELNINYENRGIYYLLKRYTIKNNQNKLIIKK